jgi:hypothetical protein
LKSKKTPVLRKRSVVVSVNRNILRAKVDTYDTVQGEEDNDILYGGDGGDGILGGGRHDTLHVEEDHDYLYGMTDNNTMNGGAGADRLYDQAGDDTDNLIGSNGSARI